jgi:triosephosphate isomerase (TIM)
MNAPLVVGNWKMNGGSESSLKLVRQISQQLQKQPTGAQVALAPPFTALLTVKKIVEKARMELAAQNCHGQDSGAFTGEISPTMLREIGCRSVIVGHSERRQIFCESDDAIAQKVAAVIKHGMRPILCVGETIEQRKSEQTAAVIVRQLDSALKDIGEGAIDRVAVAYEPVWAIGTGLNASAEQIRETHAQIRNFLTSRFDKTTGEQVQILYGGSVKADNAGMIARIESVNGVLVGGASLTADSFVEIIRAFSFN